MAIEEIPLVLLGVKFVRAWLWGRGLRFAVRRAFHHWERAIELVGFLVLIIGLFLESQTQGTVRDKEDARYRQVTKEAVNATQRATSAEGNLQSMGARIAKLEEGYRALTSHPAPALPVPPTSAVPSPPVSPLGAPYSLSEGAKRIIRDTVRTGALISIVPYMPNLDSFAADLGATLRTIPGTQVAVGCCNVIMNGQTGMIVQYDRGNLASASVFEALKKAGLDPREGASTPGNPVVVIRVAPR